ncbi:MAG: hypothetical protein H6704_21855 [Myxococcales bacterium]|nr:hypothetical protein [Myxococcales bacterium]
MRYLTAMSLMLVACTVRAEGPEEYGDVHWNRDAAAAQTKAKASGKPILLLFTEVPGCSTVKGYAKRVLKDDLLVEAAETLFVPLVIHNNTDQGTPDRALLDRFGEAAWNNPVLYVVDADLKPLVPRLAGDYTPVGTAATMVAGLEKAGRPVPTWLRAKSARADGAAVYQMYCFWSGEAALGGLPGVVSTSPGFHDGAEVVAVRFDPRVTDADTLAKRAGVKRVDAKPEAVRPAPNDRNYRLKRSPLASLPLDETQQTRVNAALAAGADPMPFLSPRQRAQASR